MAALIRGNVARTIMSSTERDTILPDQSLVTTGQSSRNKEQRPIIYGHFWVDEFTGRPPTIRQLLYLVELAQLYLEPTRQWLQAYKDLPMDRSEALLDSIYIKCSDESDALAALVDNFRAVSTSLKSYTVQRRKKGMRRFAPSLTQFDKTKKWLDDLQQYCRSVPEEQRDFKRAPREFAHIGWTIEPTIQERKHSNHDQSVPLMNLMEALGQIHLKRGGSGPSPWANYVMKYYILFDCFVEAHASLGEHLISRLSQSYTWIHPWAFNSIIGGTQILSAGTVGQKAWAVQWTRYQKTGAQERFRVQDNKAKEDLHRAKVSALATEMKLDQITAMQEYHEMKEKVKALRKPNQQKKKEVEALLAEIHAECEERLQTLLRSAKLIEMVEKVLPMFANLRAAQREYLDAIGQKRLPVLWPSSGLEDSEWEGDEVEGDE